MLNRIQLIGRLTRDPELRYVGGGHPMAQFTVAVDRDFTNGQGERETDFVRCVAWRKLAELVGQYCTRGRLVAIEGRLQTRSYETQDGARRTMTEVVGDHVWFLDRPRGDAQPEGDTGAAAGAGDSDDAQDRDPEVLAEAAAEPE